MNGELHVELPKEKFAIHVSTYRHTIFMDDSTLFQKCEELSGGKGGNTGVVQKQS